MNLWQRGGRVFHPSAWLVWITAGSLAALLIRNPWYLLLLSGVALGVLWQVEAAFPRTALRLFLSLLIFPTLLNLLFSRSGSTVLIQLPLRYLGGPYTLEALLFGLSAGLQIGSLLLIMLVFSSVIKPADILRRLPPGIYPVGVTASIAMAFAPQARRSFQSLREAQQVRGYRPKGWRDLPQVVTPLVILSLENALALAEGLAVRGWGRQALKGWSRVAAAVGAVGFATALVLWALEPGAGWWIAGLGLLGIAGLVIAFRSPFGGGRFRPEVWQRRDSLITGSSAGVLALFAGISLAVPEWLSYYPYPRAAWPTFRWQLALALGILALPLLWRWLNRPAGGLRAPMEGVEGQPLVLPQEKGQGGDR